jgi:hypothetical protein
VRCPIWLGWTITGIAFYFLLGPKLCHHVYYEMMMLPAAAIWGAVAWRAIGRWMQLSWLRGHWGTFCLFAAGLLPMIVKETPAMEVGCLKAAREADQLCSPAGRIVVAGIGAECVEILHYTHRQGWVIANPPLTDEGCSRLARYHAMGAEYLVLYFNSDIPLWKRHWYLSFADSLPVVDHQAGKWSALGNRWSEFYILDLRSLEAKSNDASASALARPKQGGQS